MNPAQTAYFLSVLLVLLASVPVASGEDNGKSVEEMVRQSAVARDVPGLVDALPALETLWPQNPQAYLDAIKQAAPVLCAAPSPEARHAALDAFARVMAKTAPSDIPSTIAYFQLKKDLVNDFCTLKEVRSDRARLLMIADFLAEIRSRRIPGYQNKGTNVPGHQILSDARVHSPEDLPTTVLKDAYAKDVEQNKVDLEMNYLQTDLFSADSFIMLLLRSYTRNFPATEAANRDFLQELADRGKLTSDERAELQSPRR